MRKFLLLFFLILASQCIHAQHADSLFKYVKFRNIGPFRGGRSVTATGVAGDPATYYMGTTGGGVWKTNDAGTTWKNISDGFFTTGSVGAIAVSESEPNIVYVGMGEHAPRGVMTSYGDGVFKSHDGGKTWKKLGLEKTVHIARIVIHPRNPDIVFVAAQGALHGPSSERGIYKSTNGGATWKKVLYVNDLTGCSELSMDMNNPTVLYATMWHHQRLPWKVISGGPGSGVYKSTDAGETWEKIENGLPKELGKMAISVSRANSDKVYLLAESDTEKELGGLFVSTNAGKSWSRISDDHRLVQRAWYYIEVFADPVNENIVYVMSAPALRSQDGGRTWENIYGPHGDYHDLWINPKNNKNMVIADDGGAGISFNFGETFSTQSNMPTAQFYRISTDNAFPYRIYAGQQDNSTVRIQSIALGSYGISQENWTSSAGGESAFLAFDPDKPDEVMGGSYLGTIDLLYPDARAGTNVMAAPIQYLGRETKNMKYRFNWNAPIIWSKHEPGTFYHGAQYLLRTRDKGLTWEEASPDLTRNEKDKQGKGGGPYTNEAVGAENYGTLSYVIESPKEKGVIWTGSDDGLVYLTRDGGKTWNNVTPKGLAECLINAIDISAHDNGTAYIATTRYKFNDFTPAIYKTTDYGKTWVNISKGIPYGAYTRVVREDPAQRGLLFAGTETGLYISSNGGNSWSKFQLNLPIVPITDLQFKNNDLIVATMGRAFWILDDLGVIRQFTGRESFHVYKPEDAVIGNWGSPLSGQIGETFSGTNEYEGINPANGVVIYYHLPKLKDNEELKMEIRDNEGNLVRAFSSESDKDYRGYAGGPPPAPVLPTKNGLNRFVWDMRYPTMAGAPTAYVEGSYRGHKAIPGTYKITIRYGTSEATTNCVILPNPLYPVTPGAYQEYHQFMSTMEQAFTDMHLKVNAMLKVRNRLDELVKEMGSNPKFTQLAQEATALTEKMKAWDSDMIQRKAKAYDDVDNYENKFTANLLFLINHSESDVPRINKPSRDRFDELMKEWATLDARQKEIMEKDVPAISKKLWDAGVGPITTSLK